MRKTKNGVKILVTGANGYLGMGVVRQLVSDGMDVVATGRGQNFIDSSVNVSYISADIFTISSPYDFFNKPDILLHLAWEDGFKHSSEKHIDRFSDHYHFIEKMVKGGVKQCAVMGSVHEIGFYEGSVDENTPPFPESLYGISKNALRDAVRLLCKEKGIIFQWLRGYYIVGNPEYGCSVFSKLYSASKDGQTEFPFTMGENQFDFIDYDEFCHQVAKTVEQDSVTGIINVCHGRPEKLADRVERFIKENELNIKLNYGAFPDRPYDSKAIWGDSTKIERIMSETAVISEVNTTVQQSRDSKTVYYRIVCVIPLYDPKQEELDNIASYASVLDYCILMDDSPKSNEALCKPLVYSFHNHMEYVWNQENIGLCKSANYGIKRAVEMGAEWVLIMNPDSKMHNDIVSVYRDYIDKNNTDDIAILAPQYNYDRHKRSVKVGIRSINFAMMSGSLMNVKALKRIGLYDERFFIDGLDNEWCLRALKAGYRIIECSEAMLDHHPAETKELKILGKTVFKYGQDSPSRYYYQFRSFFIIHDEYHSLCNDAFCLYKYLKAMILFDNRSAYKQVWKQAKEDYKAGYFGKYRRIREDGEDTDVINFPEFRKGGGVNRYKRFSIAPAQKAYTLLPIGQEVWSLAA